MERGQNGDEPRSRWVFEAESVRDRSTAEWGKVKATDLSLFPQCNGCMKRRMRQEAVIPI